MYGPYKDKVKGEDQAYGIFDPGRARPVRGGVREKTNEKKIQ